ncbi:hypothetical protein AAMO2058_000908800 [Amorphochlora amoebiformis]|uniref:Uncharacterized protein n=1 Tax=Amorphochlora amoebiformis TaxID=1561963 RepID=A0A7S0D848_9EUKA|mmetsp:Transcript_19964/g.31636  ORF Transcript_19964/g.31636 Transcript_19964/m.31636 type:complete len:501 (+) Transcript_19964:72-1574(+)
MNRKKATTESVVKAYTDVEGYESMDMDRARNSFFRRSIQTAISRLGARNRRVLEIGPGGSATLTRMALMAADDVVVLAVEANRAAAMSAARKLNGFGPHRFSIVPGSSREVLHEQLGRRLKNIIVREGRTRGEKLVRETAEPEDPRFSVLLAEILGIFSSSEGFCHILADIARKGVLCDDNLCLIPRFFRTEMVPCRVGYDQKLKAGFYRSWRRKGRPSAIKEFIQKNFAIRGDIRVPTHGTTSTDQLGALIVEEWDSKDILDTKPNDGLTRIFHSTLTVQEPCSINALLGYIVFGSTEAIATSAPWAEKKIRCTNWDLPVFVLSKELRLHRKSVLELVSIVNAISISPTYHLTLRVDGNLIEEIKIGFSDIYEDCEWISLRMLTDGEDEAVEAVVTAEIPERKDEGTRSRNLKRKKLEIRGRARKTTLESVISGRKRKISEFDPSSEAENLKEWRKLEDSNQPEASVAPTSLPNPKGNRSHTSLLPNHPQVQVQHHLSR